ncbi:hypothetical protein P4S67_10140 [Pseudoalteromonas sp. B137]
MANSIILKSLLETIKWLFIWLTVAGLVLGVLSQGFIFDTSDGLDVLLIIVLLMFQHRLKFDEHNNQIDIKLGAYFLRKKSLRLVTIPLTLARLKQFHAKIIKPLV